MARIEKAVRKQTVENNSIKNITKWKNYIMEKIVEDEELSKLLHYNNPECLSSPSLNDEDRYGLVNSRVFGYRFIPEVAEKANSWISMSFSGFVPQEGYRQFSKKYLMGNIFFYILVDSKIMETHTGYRQDLIAARLYEIFQSNRDLGIGELNMMTFIENWEHNNKLGGYTIGFETVDFK